MKTIMIVSWICAAVPLFAGPLHDAARKGDTAALARALGAGASVNEKDAAGVTPLMEAAWHGKLEAVKFLIAKKADVNAKSAKGGTALMEACIKGYAPVVKALVDAGADVNAVNASETTALMWACAKGYPEVVKILLEKGAYVNVISKPINPHYSTEDKKEYGEEKRPEPGKSALIFAVSGGHREIVRLLLEKGAKVLLDCKSVDCGAYTNMSFIQPLTYAVWKRDRELVKMLLARGAGAALKCDEECMNHSGPLVSAVIDNDPDMVELLLKNGVSANSSGSVHNGWCYASSTALGIALYTRIRGDSELIEHERSDARLRGKIDNEKKLDNDGPDKTRKIIQLLMDNGAKVNVDITLSGAPEGNPPSIYCVTLAVAAGMTDVVKTMVNRGAPVNPNGTDDAEKGDVVSPLAVASKWGSTEIIQFLLDKGAQINLPEYDFDFIWNDIRYGEGKKFTPLYFAISGGNVEAVKLLISRGADLKPNSANNPETNLVKLARDLNHQAIVKILLDAGAKE